MEQRYEQISFLENNDAINYSQIDKKQEVYSAATTGRTYQRKPYKPYNKPFGFQKNSTQSAAYKNGSAVKRLPKIDAEGTEETFVRRLSNKAPETSSGDIFVRKSPNKAPEGVSIRKDSINTAESSEGVYVRRLPNKAFDQEYMTEWIREVKFLQEKGIRYVYVKKTPDYGVSQFKYKKTPELFAALLEFYTQVEREKANVASVDEAQEALKGTGIEIRRGRNGEVKFVKTSAVDDRAIEIVEVKTEVDPA